MDCIGPNIPADVNFSRDIVFGKYLSNLNKMTNIDPEVESIS